MELLIFVFIVAGIAGWIYRSGKRAGSRKGFWAGLKRRDRRR